MPHEEYGNTGDAVCSLANEVLDDYSSNTTEAFGTLDTAPTEVRWAVAVAAFAQRLRGDSALEGFSYGAIAELANTTRGPDPEGYRAEFVRLVRTAETLRAIGQR